MIIFKLKELQSRYNITGRALAAQLGVVPSVVSDWRTGKKSPTLERAGEILEAIVAIGDQKRLEIDPPSLIELAEWRPDKNLCATANQLTTKDS